MKYNIEYLLEAKYEHSSLISYVSLRHIKSILSQKKVVFLFFSVLPYQPNKHQFKIHLSQFRIFEAIPKTGLVLIEIFLPNSSFFKLFLVCKMKD